MLFLKIIIEVVIFINNQLKSVSSKDSNLKNCYSMKNEI